MAERCRGSVALYADSALRGAITSMSGGASCCPKTAVNTKSVDMANIGRLSEPIIRCSAS